MKSRPNANPVLDRMRDDDWDDPWGTAISWAFAVAEVLHAHGETVPTEMQFRPSPVIVPDPDREPEEYPDAYVWEMLHAEGVTIQDLQFAGRCLARYLDWLRAAGKDY
jgi:hypothetical protein